MPMCSLPLSVLRVLRKYLSVHREIFLIAHIWKAVQYTIFKTVQRYYKLEGYFEHLVLSEVEEFLRTDRLLD